ncbi:hypothetical protein HDV62DRAFT_149745 [Trichoderma sp. SZMC 28011]
MIPGLNSRRRFVSFRLLVALRCLSFLLLYSSKSHAISPFSKERLNKCQRKERQSSWRRKKQSNDARTSAGHEEKKSKRKKRANGRKRRSEGRGDDDSNLSAKAQGRTGPPEICSCTRTSCRYLHGAARHTDKDQQRYLYFAPAQLRCVVLQVVLQVLVRTRARPLGSPVQKPSCTT